MLRVHYRAPEALPSHHRDCPARPPSGEYPGAEGSNQFALLVALYLFALIGGIVLLGKITSTAIPNTVSAEILAGR